jgi:hypothetical protein
MGTGDSRTLNASPPAPFCAAAETENNKTARNAAAVPTRPRCVAIVCFTQEANDSEFSVLN